VAGRASQTAGRLRRSTCMGSIASTLDMTLGRAVQSGAAGRGEWACTPTRASPGLCTGADPGCEDFNGTSRKEGRMLSRKQMEGLICQPENGDRSKCLKPAVGYNYDIKKARWAGCQEKARASHFPLTVCSQ
jgi:hypothetical protein